MIDKESVLGHPQCLIIAPTRELVIQIHNEARKFASRTIIKVAIAYGGTASRHQSENISRGCHVLVATPGQFPVFDLFRILRFFSFSTGRLMDFVNKNIITFENLKFLVLDEADRELFVLHRFKTIFNFYYFYLQLQECWTWVSKIPSIKSLTIQH